MWNMYLKIIFCNFGNIYVIYDYFNEIFCLIGMIIILFNLFNNFKRTKFYKF